MGEAVALVPCCKCGGQCVSVPSAWLRGEALCQDCRPAPVIPPGGVSWTPARPRVVVGELVDAIHLASRPAPGSAPDPRVLIAAHDVLPTYRGTPGTRSAHRAAEARSDCRVRLTYALAMAPDGAPVESLVLRLRHVGTDRVLGHFGWVNGQPQSGWIRDNWPPIVGIAEFMCWLEGRPYAAECPRCGKRIRLKGDGGFYAHKCAQAAVSAGGNGAGDPAGAGDSGLRS